MNVSMSVAMRMRSFAVLKSDPDTISVMNRNKIIHSLLAQMGINDDMPLHVEVVIEIENSIQTSCIPLNIWIKDAFGGQEIPPDFIARRINQI